MGTQHEDKSMVTHDHPAFYPFDDVSVYDDAFYSPGHRNSSIAAHRRETSLHQKERLRRLKIQKEEEGARRQLQEQHLHELESRRQHHQRRQHEKALKKMEQKRRTPKQKKWQPHVKKTNAATSIQASFRDYRRRKNASMRVQAAFRGFVDRKVVSSLRKLQQIDTEFRHLIVNSGPGVFSKQQCQKQVLFFNESTLALLLKVDAIGGLKVRHMRKQLVKSMNHWMDLADQVAIEMPNGTPSAN